MKIKLLKGVRPPGFRYGKDKCRRNSNNIFSRLRVAKRKNYSYQGNLKQSLDEIWCCPLKTPPKNPYVALAKSRMFLILPGQHENAPEKSPKGNTKISCSETS